MNDYFDSAGELRDAIASWERIRNQVQTGVNWRFTTADARIKLRKLYPSF